jgi:hypothetical protein
MSTACRLCPAHDQCTTAARGGRQLTVKPRALHEALRTRVRRRGQTQGQTP